MNDETAMAADYDALMDAIKARDVALRDYWIRVDEEWSEAEIHDAAVQIDTELERIVGLFQQANGGRATMSDNERWQRRCISLRNGDDALLVDLSSLLSDPRIPESEADHARADLRETRARLRAAMEGQG